MALTQYIPLCCTFKKNRGFSTVLYIILLYLPLP